MPSPIVSAYLAKHPDIANNFNDPGFQSTFGTLERYALSDMAANGDPTEKSFASTDAIALARHPDLLPLFEQAKAANPGLSATDFVIQYGDAHPQDNRFDDPSLQKELGIEPAPKSNLPAEQAFGNYAVDQANLDIIADKKRKEDAAALIAGYQPSIDASRKTIADLGNSVDLEDYYKQVPGLKEYYDREHAKGDQASWPNIANMTPEQFVEDHFAKMGAKYNLTPPKQSTALLRSEYDASNTASAAQTTALGAQITGLQGNLADQLAAKKAALAAQLTQLNSGIGQHTDAQRAALSQEIGAKQQAIDAQVAQLGTGIDTHTAAANATLNTQLASLKDSLSGELAAKASNLQAQVATLASGLANFTAEERAALIQQVAAQFKALGDEVETKRGAIATQLSTMGQGVTEQDVARRTALQTELNQLSAAQAPLNAARTAGAQALATAVNLGAQSEQDRIRAQAGQAGYVGESSGDIMALTRATVGGRQDAARALADANTANAADTAGIGRYGANKEYGIADTTADQRQSLTNQGAFDNRALTDYSATENRGISNFGSAGDRAISSANAKGTLDINTLNAGETRSLGDYGATQSRGISDFGTNSKASISNSDADQRLQLNSFGAGENRGLSDYGSTGTRTISNTDADQRLQMNTFGAGETRGLADFGADQGRAIGDLGANDTRGIADSAASRNLSFFSNDLQRRLATLSLPSAAIKTEFDLRNAADNYGQSGFDRAMANLNKFRVDGGNAPLTQTGPLIQPADNSVDKIGGALTGVAFGIGQANNWWAKPTTPKTDKPT